MLHTNSKPKSSLPITGVDAESRRDDFLPKGIGPRKMFHLLCGYQPTDWMGTTEQFQSAYGMRLLTQAFKQRRSCFPLASLSICRPRITIICGWLHVLTPFPVLAIQLAKTTAECQVLMPIMWTGRRQRCWCKCEASRVYRASTRQSYTVRLSKTRWPGQTRCIKRLITHGDSRLYKPNYMRTTQAGSLTH